ncbi:peptidase inhibitor family I36 protein [Streptomyces sp. B1866]|uniref:peptidase inhibitor family I36 protein n=1 Tax=Streptomyces sp. B1866 TaxID=3075431 RepID=UPI0028901B44|nr:peptidase inhibitor family I36 protein [Streptomyces sp. B1866]MDT3398596.1 peptidase inhibitor family I36 protein [Streptomyces sp. B1866]
MSKRIKALAASAVAVAAGALTMVMPGTASAAGTCSSGYFCVWSDTGFTGNKVSWSGSDSIWPDSVWNKDSSWINSGITGPGVPSLVKVYPLNFQTGFYTLCIGPGQKIDWNPGANDNGQSHGWYSSC